MLSTQQFENCSNFSQELELKQLVQSNRVSIVYIHGTARSGSTIAEIVLTQLADLAIHQPFRGVLQKAGGRFRIAKMNFDADIYNSACGLIVKQINQHLQNKQKIIVIIKELAGFFHPYIWQRWLEIPDKFLFTIREPHIQYMSWLSAMTDKVFQGNGKLQENIDFVTSKARVTESSFLSAEWEGTTLSCNQAAWNALAEDFNQVKKSVLNTDKKIAILDLVILRYNPEFAIKSIIAKLGFSLEKISQFNLNCLTESKQKISDLRDKSRPMVRKANSSKTINPLALGEAINLNTFPFKSQEHIRQIIPLYLDLLYAPEQVYLPTLSELELNQNPGLIATHPFVAYAIAMLNFQRLKKPISSNQVSSWLKSVIRNKSNQAAADLGSFNSSFAEINSYWNL
ncbi:MAG: hypothetical protein HC775_02015 [Hyellaceae cyanobacterium CSU_1_1]|nr:hypothetical protein [Hyellaceae cyanobacterium CSU_1_1]